MLVTREKYAIRSDQIGIEVSLQTRRRHEREKWPKNSLAVPSPDTYRNRSLTKHHTFLGQLSITIVVTWFMLVSRDTRFRERGATKLRIKIPRLHADNKKYVCIQRVNAHNIVFHRERTRIYIYGDGMEKNERGATEFAWLLIVDVEPLATYSPPFPLVFAYSSRPDFVLIVRK